MQIIFHFRGNRRQTKNDHEQRKCWTNFFFWILKAHYIAVFTVTTVLITLITIFKKLLSKKCKLRLKLKNLKTTVSCTFWRLYVACPPLKSTDRNTGWVELKLLAGKLSCFLKKNYSYQNTRPKIWHKLYPSWCPNNLNLSFAFQKNRE